MRNWHDRAIELKRLYSYDRTAEILRGEFQDKRITYNAVRNFIRRHPDYKLFVKEPEGKANVVSEKESQTECAEEKQRVEHRSDGSVISDRIIEIVEGEDKNPASILKAHGFDASQWQIVNCVNNLWHGQKKGGDRVRLYQSKLVVKPLFGQVSFADIDRYFENKVYVPVKALSNPYNYDKDGEVLEIATPDIHAGLMSWHRETGKDYDLHIAKERFMHCISDIVLRCRGRKFKGIVFATLGDLMHIDNDNQTTTKGTFQQADGRTAKIFDFTLDMLIDALTMLLEIAPVEFVYVSGNHARTLEYPLVKALSLAFKCDPNVRFDIEPNPQKAKLIGCNLIGLTHGDMAKTNMRGWLQSKFRQEFGQARHVEIHAGHYHTDKTVEIKQTTGNEGMIVRYLPTICAASYWEHQQGYPDGERAVVSFVWNTETGLREMWYSSI